MEEVTSMTKLTISPVTRIEGHLKIDVDIEGGKVVDAKSTGTMFRGFEIILKGRDPRDASQITQRICGVCPTAHGTASVRCLDNAFGVKPPTNGRIIRNLIFGSDYLMSHILHFYHLVALDYVKGPDTEPFIPRYEGDYRLDPKTNKVAVEQYIKALDIRQKCHQLMALFGGKAPIAYGLIAGGTTEIPTLDKMVSFQWRLKEIKEFIDGTYLPTVYLVAGAYKDLFGVGAGCKNLISFGVFPLDDEEKTFLLKPGAYTQGKDLPLDQTQIREYVKYSWYQDKTTGLHPSKGMTEPEFDKKGAYSWVKAPRYRDLPHEAGPFARMWITNPVLSKHANKFLGIDEKKEIRFRDLGDKAFSILGRIAARAEETKLVADAMEKWILQLKPGAPSNVKAEIPKEAMGMGLTEAPRGAVGHWISIKDQKIDNYQVVAATIWNASPRDDKGLLGPIEQALIGTPVKDIKNPFNVVRVVRSFDP
jgi:hydrogenase large subunit